MFDDWRAGFVIVNERCPGDNNWSPHSMNVLTENRIKVSGVCVWCYLMIWPWTRIPPCYFIKLQSLSYLNILISLCHMNCQLDIDFCFKQIRFWFDQICRLTDRILMSNSMNIYKIWCRVNVIQMPKYFPLYYSILHILC